ncbi:MAG: TetR/AcrR family transcriptional regulator, partial [Candidatus Thorarchaeota archaeon]
MPRLDNPKEEILKTTLSKLQTKSYNSISYKDISEEIGIKKASLYHHYPTKEELGFTVLHNYRLRINDLIRRAEEKWDNPWDKLESYLKFFTRLREKDDKICIGGVLTVEYNTLPEKIQNELREL